VELTGRTRGVRVGVAAVLVVPRQADVAGAAEDAARRGAGDGAVSGPVPPGVVAGPVPADALAGEAKARDGVALVAGMPDHAGLGSPAMSLPAAGAPDIGGGAIVTVIVGTSPSGDGFAEAVASAAPQAMQGPLRREFMVPQLLHFQVAGTAMCRTILVCELGGWRETVLAGWPGRRELDEPDGLLGGVQANPLRVIDPRRQIGPEADDGQRAGVRRGGLRGRVRPSGLLVPQAALPATLGRARRRPGWLGWPWAGGEWRRHRCRRLMAHGIWLRRAHRLVASPLSVRPASMRRLSFQARRARPLAMGPRGALAAGAYPVGKHRVSVQAFSGHAATVYPGGESLHIGGERAGEGELDGHAAEPRLGHGHARGQLKDDGIDGGRSGAADARADLMVRAPDRHLAPALPAHPEIAVGVDQLDAVAVEHCRV
jgi:hypothetical protein